MLFLFSIFREKNKTYFLKPYLANWSLCTPSSLEIYWNWQYNQQNTRTLLHKTRADKGLPCTKLATSLLQIFFLREWGCLYTGYHKTIKVSLSPAGVALDLLTRRAFEARSAIVRARSARRTTLRKSRVARLHRDPGESGPNVASAESTP